MKVLGRPGYTVSELLLTVGATCVVASVVFPLFVRAREDSRTRSCRDNLKTIGLALLQYAQDYDQRFPHAALASSAATNLTYRSHYGWADALHPYLKSNQSLQCFAETALATNSDDPTARGYTDYYLNLRLSGVAQKYLMRAGNTVLCGEGNDGHDQTDARYALNILPPNWYSLDSPARRHKGKANYLFCDGHVGSYRIGDPLVRFDFR